MKKQIISILLITVTMFTVISSFLLFNINSKASGGMITGSEHADKIEDFGFNVTLQNQYKIWSVCKSAGMTDAQAMGVLCNMMGENGCHPEKVEGCYGSNMDTPQGVSDYINNYSSKMTDANWQTQQCTKNLISMGVSSDVVSSALAGNGPSSSNGLSISTYISNGRGYCGFGLHQWTGVGWFDTISNFAQAHNNSNWYDIDAQLCYIVTLPENGGFSLNSNTFQTYIDATAGINDVSECCYQYNALLVNPGAGRDNQYYTKKLAFIDEMQELFSGKKWDDTYGKGVLDGSGIKGSGKIKTHDGINVVSMYHALMQRVVTYPRNDGFLLAESTSEMEQRNKEVNADYFKAVRDGSLSGGDKQYSLFELYGEDLHWYNYYGEESYIPTKLDLIYSAYDSNRLDELDLGSTIFYGAYNYLSCRVYPERPTVLTEQMINNGYVDTRVSAMSNTQHHIAYTSGSWKMTVSKFIVSLFSLMCGPELRELTLSLIESIETSEFWEAIRLPLQIIVGFGVIALIISIAIKSVKYAKNGSVSMREIIIRFLVALLCIGLIWAIFAAPTKINWIIDKVVNAVDEIGNEVIAIDLNDDDIIAVQDKSKATHAVIWKTAIFNPWVRGQFGDDYEHLYTNYATDLKDGQSAMPQSNQEIDTSDPTIRTPFFNSTKCTGDVFVYAGNGKYIRNWAAYLYSLNTPYHIDSTVDSEAVKGIDVNNITFPNSTQKTTANDPDLYADLFRVIDAQMNISPQFFADGDVIENYTDSHELDPSYVSESLIMLFNCLLLLVMFPVVIQKLIYYIKLLLTLIKILVFAVLEIFKEGRLGELWGDLKNNFFNYSLYSFKLVVMITLYYKLVDKSIFFDAIYLVISWAILSFSLNDIKRMGAEVKHRFNRIKEKIPSKK